MRRRGAESIVAVSQDLRRRVPRFRLRCGFGILRILPLESGLRERCVTAAHGVGPKGDDGHPLRFIGSATTARCPPRIVDAAEVRRVPVVELERHQRRRGVGGLRRPDPRRWSPAGRRRGPRSRPRMRPPPAPAPAASAVLTAMDAATQIASPGAEVGECRLQTACLLGPFRCARRLLLRAVQRGSSRATPQPTRPSHRRRYRRRNNSCAGRISTSPPGSHETTARRPRDRNECRWAGQSGVIV